MRIGIGEGLTALPLPHHQTCGSASGGSVKLAKPNFALGNFSFRSTRLRPLVPDAYLSPSVFTSASGLVLPAFDCLRRHLSSLYPILDRSALRPVSRFPCSPWMVVTPPTNMASADFCNAVRKPLDLLSLVYKTLCRSPRIRYDNFPLTLAAFT